MFKRQNEKLLKGKSKIIVYVESIFVLVLLGSMVFAINQDLSIYFEIQDQFFTNLAIDTPERLIQQTKEWETND